MRWLLPLLFLVPLLAGCTDSPAGTDSTDDGAMPTESEPEFMDQEVEKVTKTPVDWSGHTKEAAFICSDPQGATGCPAGQQVQPDGAFQTIVTYEGQVTGADLRLEWTPVDGTQTGGLVLAVYTPNYGQLLAISDGASSFDASFEFTDPDGTEVWLNVWPGAKTGAGGQYVFADATQQPFTVTGTMYGTITETVQVPVE